MKKVFLFFLFFFSFVYFIFAEEPLVTPKLIKKPQLVVVAGTYCPHCRQEVPAIEKEIFEKVGEQVDIFVNVVDYPQGHHFDVKMKQGFNPQLSYENLVGEKCGYIPTWILLDKNGKVADYSCGSRKGVKTIIEDLKGMGVKFGDNKKNEEEGTKKVNDEAKNDFSQTNTKNFYYFGIFLLIILGFYFIGKRFNQK